MLGLSENFFSLQILSVREHLTGMTFIILGVYELICNYYWQASRYGPFVPWLMQIKFCHVEVFFFHIALCLFTAVKDITLEVVQ